MDTHRQAPRWAIGLLLAGQIPPLWVATALTPVGDLTAPQRFITAPSDTCSTFLSYLDRMAVKLEPWYKTDPRISAPQRSSADTVLYDMAAGVFSRSADEWEQIGRSSGNPVTEDFLVMSAQYLRAYIAAIPTYAPADQQLYEVARHLGAVLKGACKAVQK